MIHSELLIAESRPLSSRLIASTRRLLTAPAEKQRPSALPSITRPIQPRAIRLLHLDTASSLVDMNTAKDLSVDETRAKLKQQFVDFQGEEYARGWADLWEKNFLPWDRLQPSPALAETLINGSHLVGTCFIEEDGQTRRKRALVPGCGRGVDVLLLQSFGYDAVGLEVSPKAVEACEAFAKEKQDDYPVRDENAGKGSCKFVLGDFYKDDWTERAGLDKGTKFELIYDYTVSSCVDRR